MSDLITIREAAAELRCSRAHVYNIMNGKVTGLPALPHLELGRRRLIRRSALLAWLEAIEVGRKVVGSVRCRDLTPLDAWMEEHA